MFFPNRVGRRQVMTSFKNANTLSATKAFCQHMDHRSIDIVDALAKIVQFCLCVLIVRHAPLVL